MCKAKNQISMLVCCYTDHGSSVVEHNLDLFICGLFLKGKSFNTTLTFHTIPFVHPFFPSKYTKGHSPTSSFFALLFPLFFLLPYQCQVNKVRTFFLLPFPPILLGFFDNLTNILCKYITVCY